MVRIDINMGNMPGMQPQAGSGTQQTKQVIALTSEMILQYLLGTDEKVETLILCKPENTELMTTDHNVYEALGSTTQQDNIQLNKMTKLFETVHIVSFKERNRKEKPILKEDRVEELRKSAIANTSKQNTIKNTQK